MSAQGWSQLDKSFTEWLYADDWSKEKLSLFEILYAIPGSRQYIDYKLDVRKDNEYLTRYGMDYSDIHDPRKLNQVSSVARSLEWVSHNISRLYKNDSDSSR